MPSHVLAIDEGSTGVRAHVFDAEGEAVGSAYHEISRAHPKPGWSEHDPREIVDATRQVAGSALQGAGIKPSDLAAVGIASQRSSCLVWERSTGAPLYPIIGWQDLRTTMSCEQLNRRGIMTNPLASATKLKWILDHTGAARRRPEELCLGTIDSWLAWHLTGGAHVTDHSHASCTGLYDFVSNAWDPGLLELIGLPHQSLPHIVETSESVGTTNSDFLGAPVPLGALAGDQQAAMFGQLCFDKGGIKTSYGTSAMVDLNVGPTFLLSPHGAYPLVLWKLGGEISYCLEGTVVTAGASFQWLRDSLGMVSEVAQLDSLAATVPDSGGVWCLPAFQGLGTPYLDVHQRAQIGGLSLATTRAHVARALLEAIAFRCRQVVEALRADACGAHISSVRVDGGAARSDLLMQLQADLLGLPIERPQMLDAASLGVAYLAGLAGKLWNGYGDLRSIWKRDRVFEPQTGQAERDERYHWWLEKIEEAKGSGGGRV